MNHLGLPGWPWVRENGYVASGHDLALLEWLSTPANPPIRYLTARDLIEPRPASDALRELREEILAWEKRLLPIEEALATRAGTVGGWEEFFESAEVAAYRAALVEGKQVCVEFQTRLDATAKRGVFADTPWTPRELSEVVAARLGCDLFPEDPANVFRSAPKTTVPESSG